MKLRLLVAVSVIALSAPAWQPPSPPSYAQRYRPQFHFSPRENWTNDPNGLVFFDGEYHLFYQFNPFGDQWGHMSWGHAVSPDLLHWRELPVALAEENGIMIFTGSTVIDERNTSGFCAGGKPCMVAIYTGHTPPAGGRRALQTQNLAYSNDRGRTWAKYRGNPVLNLNMSDFRDPGVFWSDQASRWVMVVALPDEHKVAFYNSPDLKTWDRVGEFGPAGATGGQWECPTLVQLPVDGGARATRWVLKIGVNPGGLQGGSGEQYFVGTFDGRRFVNDNPASLTLWTDYGKDCYCALVFNHLPAGAPPVMMGWMNNWQYAGKVPTSPWRGQMTVPRRVALRKLPQGIRLVQEPVDVASLHGGRFSWLGDDPAELNRRLRSAQAESYALDATVAPGGAQEIGWRIAAADGAYTEIGYSKPRGEIFVDRTHSGETGFSKDFPARTAAPLTLGNGPLRVRILTDRSTLEVFAQNGQVTMSNLIYPPEGAKAIEFYSHDGKPGKISIEMWDLKSAWPR